MDTVTVSQSSSTKTPRFQSQPIPQQNSPPQQPDFKKKAESDFLSFTFDIKSNKQK